uniref:Phosphate-regulating neutral endopeptidase (inferred by orthology to a human protein) n=1 Tax=Strongyloides venezuelensis TaxID=75913 RepID=A0A0K0FNG7_STRVS
MNIFILTLYTYALIFVSQRIVVADWFEYILKDIGKFSFEKLYGEKTSRSLFEYIDFDVEPCDNFYKLSCNNWIKSREKLRGSNESFAYNSRTSNFEYFIKEFGKGKYNNESRAIYTLYKLRERCNELSEDKFEDCELIIKIFGTYALSAIFIKTNKIRSEENGDYNIIEDMIVRIKEELRLLINERKDIFDEETRNNFMYKLNRMEFKKNYDEHDLSNVELMDDCYESIGINYSGKIEQILKTIDDYFKTLLDNDEHILNTCEMKIFLPKKYTYLYVYRNGWYNITSNFFTVSSDSLNEPSFSRYFPNSLNYGYLGFTLGHEMFHAFDSRNFNRILEGDNINEFNVTQMSMENYKEKSDCFVKQYSMQKESVTNLNINGLETLSENIADNGGIKIVHRAYMKWLQSNGGKDLVVPGFENFTNEQLFFISLGRSYCEYQSKDKLENQIKRSNYAPGEIRTNVALSNYKPFSNAFKCKLNSKMNPKGKCEL